MNTTLTIDMGMIVTALAPTIAIVVAALLAARSAAAQKRATAEVHSLVNDNLTREMRRRLIVLRSLLVTMSRLDATDADRLVINDLEKNISETDAEIKQRDRLAAMLSKS